MKTENLATEGLFGRPLTENERAKIAQLADDMECGAAIRPQCYGGFFDLRKDDLYASCALGAAWECFNIRKTNEFDPSDPLMMPSSSENILRMYGGHIADLSLTDALLSADGEYITHEESPLTTVIWKLNDHAKMTREAIAAWLRKLT